MNELKKDKKMEVAERFKSEVANKNSASSELSVQDQMTQKFKKEMMEELAYRDSEISPYLSLPSPFTFDEEGNSIFNQEAYDIIFSDDVERELITRRFGYNSFPYGAKKRIKNYLKTYLMFVLGPFILYLITNYVTLKMVVVIAIVLSPLLIVAATTYITTRWMNFYELSGVVTGINYKLSSGNRSVETSRTARKGLLMFGFGKGLMYKTITISTGDRFISFNIPDTKDSDHLSIGNQLTVVVEKGVDVKEADEGFMLERIMGYHTGFVDKKEASSLRRKGMKVDDIMKLEKRDKDRVALEEKAKSGIILIDKNEDLESISHQETKYIEEGEDGE